MRVQGLVFAGSATGHRRAMSAFVRETLELMPVEVDGVEADLFRLPDGSSFAVASPGGMGPTERTIGFLVDDLEGAVGELRAVGIDVDEPAVNAEERYVHFVAPDGELYELIERRT